MASRRDDSGLDQLFQLPLDQFTAARNALAKQSGADGAAIRQLTKPPLAAWAVNQLYWRDRESWDALIGAAEALRRTHKAVLGGRSGDLRAAGKAHDQAVDRAVKATMSLLAGSGHPATDASRQAIVSTLRALPADEAPGRLTRTLQPGGFEMLAGFPIAKGSHLASMPKPKAAPPREQAKPQPAKTKAEQARDAKALAHAREAAAAAARAAQQADQEARREEFERARAAREADKAAAAVTRAREAVAQAQQELKEAQHAEQTAATNRDRAERRATEAEKKLTAAQSKAQAAADHVKTLEP
jgi:hypothetical protein